jgi:PAS domain S-box-containing protein/diguanylate cyclase (GGDEF)-like protein
MKKEVVLIVDDSRVVQSYFNQLMNPLEFKVLVASNAKEAKMFVDEEEIINVAVVDLTLPDAEDGAVVDYTLEKKIPTIVFTGSRSEEYRNNISSKKIVDYLQKETKDDFAKIVDMIRQLRDNRNVKVLIVDDSTIFRLHLAELLQLHQFLIFHPNDGREAFTKLEKNPDTAIVLTDYEMPKMNGLQLIQNIRKKHSPYELPIIVLSTYDDSRKIANCLKEGANDYLHKPYKSEEFFSRFYLNLKNREYFFDIKEQKSLLQQYKDAIDTTSIVSKTDIDGVITYVNDMFCEASGYSKEELIGKTHNIVRHSDTPMETFKSLWSTILDKKTWNGVIENRKKNGEKYLVETTIFPIVDAKNDIKEYISIRKDITTLVEQNTIIQTQHTDTLTKLPNRGKLICDLTTLKSASITIINVDAFNEINNFYGYDIGDSLLIEVGNKIKKFTKETHTLYKLPVDEFALLGENISEIEEKIFVNDLLKHMSRTSFHIDGNEIYLHFSSGIYFGEDAHLINADIALQQAKITKKDICIFSDLPDINSMHHNNLKWVKKLHHAIEDDKIKAYFQPIVNNKNEKIEKYESLVRMIDDEEKPVSPFFFLDIAKKTKLYEKLTRAMFDQTVEIAKESKMSFSINLCVPDFKNHELINYICEKLKTNDVAKYLVFEIVESEELESSELFDAIEKLKDTGAKISIDDFGTGYSNFEYLIKLQVDFIKIDGSIVKNVLDDPHSELMLKTIVNIAIELGVKTIAEFVESEAIYKKVKEMGVDYSQGYYFSEPLENIK